ncbi:MAG: metallophosphoesterase [Verrucomicrobiota bacterium]|nr:metallophosphoesterase [Verrucomicrobiota bacterium]
MKLSGFLCHVKMTKLLTIILLALPIVLGDWQVDAEEPAKPGFTHSVKTTQKPWTHTKFLNNPEHFQFAIVSDRTGGVRRGVFPKAVKKLNELQPEFVMSVGDLITGGAKQTNESILLKQWQEFNGFIKGFEMPFFYLPGNHDVSNEAGDRVWDRLYGVRYYSFVYKDVLFLCLNTQEGPGWRPPSLGKKQIGWAVNELKKHHKVRWTLVFIHQPLWLMEEGIEIRRNGKKTLRKSDTGWPKVEQALKDRKYTVFAGHIHHYGKYIRNEQAYYMLGTTGGGSKLRGTSFGEFDHATWVTMTDKGPRLANLLIDGILADDVTTEAHQQFWRSLAFEEFFDDRLALDGKNLTLHLRNFFDFEIEGRLQWKMPKGSTLKLQPVMTEVSLKPGEEAKLKFAMQQDAGARPLRMLPRLEVKFAGGDRILDLETHLEVPVAGGKD